MIIPLSIDPSLALCTSFLACFGLDRFITGVIIMVLSMPSPLVAGKASRNIQISLFIPVYESLQDHFISDEKGNDHLLLISPVL